MGHVYNLRNSLKFKRLAFWRKWTPFIDQKCTYEKVTKNLGRAPSPLIWTKSKRTAAFFVTSSLRENVKVSLQTQRSSHKCTIYIFHQSISSTKALEALVKWKHPIVFSSTIHLWQHSAIRQDISFVEGSRFMWIGSTLQCIEITLAAFFFWSQMCFLLSKTFRV